MNQLMFYPIFVGTGYLSGCFALMVGAEGRVVGVDHIPELVHMSIKNIEKSVAASLLKKGSLSLHAGGRYSLSELYVSPSWIHYILKTRTFSYELLSKILFCLFICIYGRWKKRLGRVCTI